MSATQPSRPAHDSRAIKLGAFLFALTGLGLGALLALLSG